MKRMLCVIWLALLAAGCGSDTVTHVTPDSAVASDGPIADLSVDTVSPDTLGPGPYLRIYVRGDTSPVTFTDGYAGQTPKLHRMGLGRFDLMTSATDPSPALVFDHKDKPVDVDLLSETLAGQVSIASITPGTYTIEIWANPNGLTRSANPLVPADPVERHCRVEVRVTAGSTLNVFIEDYPFDGGECPHHIEPRLTL